MASLNLSTNSSSITKSYQSIINAPALTGRAVQSATCGIWAVFSVSTPLANAFSQGPTAQESTLKVQSTGEGELADMIEEFSDGKIQFAFAKVRDPNTTLSKHILIAWCGEGVPERTKGYFTSHTAVVSKTFHGYHIQITARSDRDVTPESIMKRVSESSGSAYSGDTSTASAPPPPLASKPVFTPSHAGVGGKGFNPLGSRAHLSKTNSLETDDDGWEQDAPPVTRSQLEKVAPSYQPTRVNLSSPNLGGGHSSTPSRQDSTDPPDPDDIIKSGYQPIGRVNIAEIRQQAQRDLSEDRPTPIKGAYEPVGKVDISAIRAASQHSLAPSASTDVSSHSKASDVPASSSSHRDTQSSPPNSDTYKSVDRLTSLPKPKITPRFGSGNASLPFSQDRTSTGPGLTTKPSSSTPQTGISRTFADQGGKTPAQLWAEKRARQGEMNDSSSHSSTANEKIENPTVSENSDARGWKSGYKGRTWAPVQIARTGQSFDESNEPDGRLRGANDGGHDSGNDRAADAPPSLSTAALHDAAPANGRPPPLDVSSKPNLSLPDRNVTGLALESGEKAGQYPVREPSPPSHQLPRSPSPPTPSAAPESPIRVAMPVSKEQASTNHMDPGEGLGASDTLGHSLMETSSPKVVDPVPSAAREPVNDVPEATNTTFSGELPSDPAADHHESSGKRALVQFDYDKAEDNEIELREGEYVTNIEMVDENWWMGRNAQGQSGLFPSNYVEMTIEGEVNPPASHPISEASKSQGKTATALYDYEAAEDNELSFHENAKIVNVEFPDDDWWSGFYDGKHGLFPANYVQLDK